MAADDIIKTTFQGKVMPNGSLVIDDTSVHTFTKYTGIKTIIPTTATVIAVATGFDETGTATNWKLNRNWTTLTSSDGVLTLPDNCYITSLQLTSGRLIAHQ